MRETRRSVCPHDCPSQCALSVTIEDGRVADVAGDPTHPFTRGVICGKVHDYAERLYAPTRVLTPLRRVGAKSEGRFEPISWETALEEIAGQWRRVIGQWGGEAILPYSYGGTLGLIQYWAGHPLFHTLGASQLDRSICIATAYAGWVATLGTVAGNDAEQLVDSDLVVLWGINASYTHINLMTLVKRARKRGAFVVCIDPYRTATARSADLYLRPRPGTDGALALGIMHVLIAEGLIDRDYIERATLGYGPLAESVRAYDPTRVSAITGLSAEEIVSLARRYGATKASFLRVGIGLSRHDNGGATCRAIACLPALTGAYAHPAGGALLSSSRTFGLDLGALERRDLMPATVPRTINMTRLGRALTESEMSPPVKALYVYNSNPASIAPNQELVLRGLAREDLFVVVHEQHLTDTTDYADIVLPATTSMEHVDLYKSFGHLYVQLAEPVVEPVGEARSNWHTVRLLARALGLRDPHFAKDEPTLIREVLASGDPSVRGITYERLRAEGSVRLNVERPYLPFAQGAPTPSGKVEFVSESLAREGQPFLPGYVPLIEGPNNAELARRFPLQCIVPPNRFFLNSSFSQSDLLRRRQKGPSVFLSPADAEARGIQDGEAVLVRSARGGARFAALITEDTRPGVAVIEGIWWSKHQAGGRGVNVITDDRVADLGGGPALHSNLVEVSKL
ncbi:MAG TPA: molybdopterin oxidoreductase family protein [Methylomirabilota bacterium]|jgi:anaerobic selenocysteine-containing dehydrogenase|nr:molybdopterin oxidoreductase family protein [Methylomirabilota bacterium]